MSESTACRSEQEGQHKKTARAATRSRLSPGEEFRPYDLFDEIGVIPVGLMACKELSPGAKLCWCAVARRLGKSGSAYPSLKKLGEDLGVLARQAARWVEELEKAGLMQSIERVNQWGASSSNEYKLLWHPVFEAGEGGGVAAKVPGRQIDHPPLDKLTTPRVDKLSYKKNHHHQKGNIEKGKVNKEARDARALPFANADESTPKKSAGKFFLAKKLDDDDRAHKRALMDNPEREFRRRLQERAWREGPISDVDSIVFFVSDDLRHEEEIYREFLDYEEAQTTPEKIKTPAAHYRALLKKFRGSRAYRHLSVQKEKLRERQQKTTVPPPICPLAKCDGRGEIWKGELLEQLCDCEAGRTLAEKAPGLLEQLKRLQGAA